MEDGEGNGTPLQYSCLENPMGAAPGKSGLHARGEGERVLALESREAKDPF